MKSISFAVLGAALALAVEANAAEPDIEAIAQTCMACHGRAGLSTDAKWPSLAGRSAGELYLGLQAFRQGRPGSRTMTDVAAKLTAAQMQALAAYFAALPGAGQ